MILRQEIKRIWGANSIDASIEELLGLCYFPIAAIAGYHKLSVCKQHKAIILQLWRSEVPKAVLAGLHFF